MISVCLASYNGAPFIKAQVASILNQLSFDDELIISDDGSSDATLAEIESFNDSRIRLVSHSKQLGIIKNFEHALKLAKGDCIFLSDQDDIWTPQKVHKSVKLLKNHLLVVSDCKVVDEALQEINPSFFQLRGSKPGVLNNIIKNSYLGCCMAFRKELLKDALPIPQGAAMHDIWLGLVAETRGSVFFLEEPLILFRRHGMNASYTAGKSVLSTFEKVRNRIVVSSLLLGRILHNYLR